MPHIMRYEKPAERWIDALPLGNGRLGAMVYGHACCERIQLNEDSLWYGGFLDRNSPALREKLPEIRRLILAQRHEEADSLVAQYVTGAPYTQRHYEPLGEIDISLNQHLPFIMGWVPNSDDASEYACELNLETGIHTVAHVQNGVRYTRETFISHPAQALCIRITADRPGAIDLDVQMDRCRIFDEKIADDRRPGKFRRGGGWAGMLLDENHALDERTLMMYGHAAETAFASAVRMVSDGNPVNPYSQILTRGATEVCLYLAGTTSNREADPRAAALRIVEAAEQRGFAALLDEHIADFSPRMARCELELGSGPDMPLEQRLARASEGASDPALAALYFSFGRYLLMAGGREGSTALNLQGIWNHEFIPSWDSKYTININTQMNYWPAAVTNLAEIDESLFDLIGRMVERGRDTAQVMYGCRGAVTHHNTDMYGDSAPQDCYLAATAWPMGGAWLALHLWEHYRFTLDLGFLKKWYPVMREYALFFVDFLIEDDEGYLVTCPSLSPENRYLTPSGYDTPICAGPSMDNQILRALFGACAQAMSLLGLDDPLANEFSAACAKLPPNRVGSDGRLLEWMGEYAEMAPGMPHVSHLFGAYPGDEINWRDAPDLLEAARKSLVARIEHGAGRGGWPLAWFICLHARMGDSGAAEREIDRLIGSFGSTNFFNGRGVFQIDADLGGVAGIAECLLQSHAGMLELLPALPPLWREGTVRGLRARGGCEVDVRWEEGALNEAAIRPIVSGPIEVRGQSLTVTLEGEPIATRRTEHGFCFQAQAGRTYALRA